MISFQKKEPKAAHNMFSNSDVYRKENVQSPHVIGAKANVTFNRGNNNQYQNQVKIKGQPIVAMQDGYFPGFYAKHPPPPNIHHQANDVMFAKHELEFHQKSMTTPQQQQQAQQFPPFHGGAGQKYDMHDYEQQLLLKNDVVNHKMPAGAVHAARPPIDFPSPQNSQMYYNENNAQNSAHNQYYPNEFDIPEGAVVSGNGSGSTSGANYFDQKTQAHYYDMNYHHHGGGGAAAAAAAAAVAGSNDYSEMYGPNAVVNENCENFASFQQYYEHHPHQQPQQQQPAHTQHAPQQQQNMHAHPHHYPPHHHIAQQSNPIATAYVHHQQNFASNAQIHGNANLTENSNSSSDFNFLSNLNDFAPEYYQLS
jgi:hypothetical protein